MSVSPYRYALNEMDKFSLKDSGRGDSEAGDSDYEPGRESPMDRLLGEGFTEIYAPDGQHRTHAGTPLAPHPHHPTTSSFTYHHSPPHHVNLNGTVISEFFFIIIIFL